MSTTTVERTRRFTAPNYARYPVAFARGEGCRLWDEDGRRYLDMIAGLGVSCLGHAHPALVAAISEQAGRLMHTSNLYCHAPGALLAERLAARTFADRVFFCNSGTEAVEAAIKMARRYGNGRYEIVATHNSFHGRTLGSLAATGQPNMHEGFGPLPGGFVHVAFGEPDAVAAAIGPRTVAVLLEPIEGEGGVVVPPDGYLAALRRICDDAGLLMILDEVQTGVGRTGTFYAHEYEGIRPDILTSAKGLAGGLPIGAVLATEQIAAAFTAGAHGSTFGANPVACSAALAVLETFDREDVLANCERAGRRLRSGLEAIAARRDDIIEVRGRGLMVGMQMTRPSKPIVEAALAKGLLINATAGTVVRFLPPLTIRADEIDEGLSILEEVLA